MHAGIIEETEQGYDFTYDVEYLSRKETHRDYRWSQMHQTSELLVTLRHFPWKHY